MKWLCWDVTAGFMEKVLFRAYIVHVLKHLLPFILMFPSQYHLHTHCDILTFKQFNGNADANQFPER